MQTKCENKGNTCKKNAKTYKENKTNANCIFLHFLEGVLSGLQIFQKLQKNLGKVQKKSETNAKQMQETCEKHANSGNVHVVQKQISRSCIFFAFLLAFFLHFPGPRFLGLHFLGAFFLHFNQVLQSLE